MANVYPLLEEIWYSKFKDWKKIQKAKPTPFISSKVIIPLFKKLYFITKFRDYIFYFEIYSRCCISKGWKSAQCHPKFMSNTEHDAIIIVHKKFAEKCLYGGIDLLIDFFRKKEMPYKIYPCYDLNTFEEIVRNQKAVNLWIFGHGSRGSISCGNQFLKYEKLKNAPGKIYIYQFHCNHGNDDSLAEYLSNGRGFVNNSFRDMIQNKVHIKQILNYWCEIQGL